MNDKVKVNDEWNAFVYENEYPSLTTKPKIDRLYTDFFYKFDLLEKNTCRKNNTEIEQYVHLFCEILEVAIKIQELEKATLTPAPIHEDATYCPRQYPHQCPHQRPHQHMPMFIQEIYRHIIDTRRFSFGGKGERELSIQMVIKLYEYIPLLATHIIQQFTVGKIGTWHDIRRICEIINAMNRAPHTSRQINTKYDTYSKLEKWCIEFMCKHLNTEYNNVLENKVNETNIAKWFPRETGKYGWLFNKCFQYWKKTYGLVDKSVFRKIIVWCSTHLQKHTRVDMTPTHTPTPTHKTSYKTSHEHINDGISQQSILEKIQTICYPWATTIPLVLKKYMNARKMYETMHSPAQALAPTKKYIDKYTRYILLQPQLDNWIYSSMALSSSNENTYILPIIDISQYTMGGGTHPTATYTQINEYSLYKAYTVGITLMMQNKHKRMLVFDQTPTWLSFENENCHEIYKSFYSKINETHAKGTTANIESAIELLVKAFSSSPAGTSPSHTTTATTPPNIVLVIISPMNFPFLEECVKKDMIDECNKYQYLNDYIQIQFTMANISPPPTIVYWNVSTNFLSFGIEYMVS